MDLYMPLVQKTKEDKDKIAHTKANLDALLWLGGDYGSSMFVSIDGNHPILSSSNLNLVMFWHVISLMMSRFVKASSMAFVMFHLSSLTTLPLASSMLLIASQVLTCIWCVLPIQMVGKRQITLPCNLDQWKHKLSTTTLSMRNKLSSCTLICGSWPMMRRTHVRRLPDHLF